MYGQSVRAISRDRLEDGIGCLGPDERLRVVIVGLNEGSDIGLELIAAADRRADADQQASARKSIVHRFRLCRSASAVDLAFASKIIDAASQICEFAPKD